MESRSTRTSTKRKTEDSKTKSSSSTNNISKKRAKQGLHKQSAATSASEAKIEQQPPPNEALKVEEETGDIFNAPPNTLIIHACNCQGSWGAGIAKAFHDRYPKAYLDYVDHCEKHGDALLDSAQLISPVDSEAAKNASNGSSNAQTPKHFVGCLYTSRHYGRKKDTPSRILAATKPAMEDLLKQIGAWNVKSDESDKVGEVRICKINSGMFAVPWEKTKAVLETIDVRNSDVKMVRVVSPAS